MSHQMFIPFIVKVSVLGNFPYVCFKFITLLKYTIINVLILQILNVISTTDFSLQYWVICFFNMFSL